MKKFVYFVRHGKSVANIDKVFQGYDDPLAEEGRKQAIVVAERIQAHIQADVLISSPMARARETAGRIAEKTGWPLVETELFREYLPPSSLVGKPTLGDEGIAYRKAMKENYADPSWHYEDEDSYFDLHERALHALQFLLDRPEERLMVVSHAGFMRAILTAMITSGEPEPELMLRLAAFLKPLNTGITVCRYKDPSVLRNKWRLISWNDHLHLTEHFEDELV